MPKTSLFSDNFLKHLFQNVNLPNIGDATGLLSGATVGSFYVSLHTATPGVGGDQTTNEATYTGYARVAVPRSTAGWTEAAGAVTNAAAITFGACTAGSSTVTYFGIGYALSGVGALLYFGALTASLAVSNGITPSFAISALSDGES